jgi:hypothetical protein
MTAQITPFPDTDDDLLWAEPGTPARMADVFAVPPPRLYRVTEAQPSGAAVVYALGAAGVVLLLMIGWVAGILTSVAVLG